MMNTEKFAIFKSPLIYKIRCFQYGQTSAHKSILNDVEISQIYSYNKYIIYVACIFDSCNGIKFTTNYLNLIEII